MKSKFLNILILLAITLPTTACIPAMILGAASGVGTYFVGRNVSDREDRKVKTEALVEIREEMEQKQAVLGAQDQSINNELNQRLVGGAFMNEIAIYPEIRNGVIILHGRVPDPQTAERVIQTARATPGVKRIISNLVIVNQRQPVPMPVQMPQPVPQQVIMQQPVQQQQPSGFKAKQFSPAIPLESGSSFRYIPPQNPTESQEKFRPNSFNNGQQGYNQQQYNSPPESRPGSRPSQMSQNQYRTQQQPQQHQTQQRPTYQPKAITTNSQNSPKINHQNNSTKKPITKKPKSTRQQKVQQNNNTVKTMSPEMLEQFSDNDGDYVKYTAPTYVKAPKPTQPVYQPTPTQPAAVTPVYTNPYIINVPTPIDDNDNYYVPYGSYNSTADSSPEIPVPVPGSIEDNDNAYELYYY